MSNFLNNLPKDREGLLNTRNMLFRRDEKASDREREKITPAINEVQLRLRRLDSVAAR